MTDTILAQLLTGVFTLAGTAAGALGTAMAGWLARRRGRRAAVGPALAALLEVRHRLRYLQVQARVFSRFPKEYGPIWMAFAEAGETILPDLTPLLTSYSSAIDLLVSSRR